MIIFFGKVKRTFSISYRVPLPSMDPPANDNGVIVNE
jgi:hypothetical protein